MLDMSAQDFRRLGHRAVDLLADHFETLGQRPCRTTVPHDVRHELMHQPVPDLGTDADVLLDYLQSTVLPYPMGNGSPRFFAWVNSPPAPIGAIGDLIAAVLNPSVAGGDHAATYLEHGVLGWMRAMVGFPPGSGAILTSGASVANLIGLAVMRHVRTGGSVRADGLRGSTPALVVYTSQEGHSCIQKAVELLGIGHANLRRVPVTASWQMDVIALQKSIDQDRAAGLTPACVAASAGTVNTGAIDPLNAVADICAAENMWFHVDAAYGGPGILLPTLAPLYDGLVRADSVVIDPHKWMYVPVECGCALVRDPHAMRDTFSVVPPYLRDDRALPWFSEFGIQQSRGFRALKLWLALKSTGLVGYRKAIAHDLEMADALRARLEASDDFEIVSDGPLSITCFRYAPASGRDDIDLDRLNRSVLEAIQQAGDVFLTGTELVGRFVLRACIVNFRTTETDVDALVTAIRSAGQRLLTDGPAVQS
jgi:aromatic-L-amino-acid decarboxylase